MRRTEHSRQERYRNRMHVLRATVRRARTAHRATDRAVPREAMAAVRREAVLRAMVRTALREAVPRMTDRAALREAVPREAV